MNLPQNKTKIVATIGPATETPEMMQAVIQAGMSVARLNFSHGEFAVHQQVIQKLRAAAKAVGRRLAIMADLPGPKMRIGQLAKEPVDLKPGDPFTLTPLPITGDARRVSVTFERLPQAVKAGDTLYLNDGLIQLEVSRVDGQDVICRIVVGGELRSRKGLNLPGIDLGISAFTTRDRECLRFALENGVDAISQSFVESAADVFAVRSAAESLGYHPFIIAKIERSRALDHLDGILEAADGIMIARGDLGVEIPIEQIAVVQKRVMRQANLMGKPVITATQMLESMTSNRRPTRAEATDVANAILDGTDCVMLSGESAMGQYPVEAVRMLAGIAAAVEPHRPSQHVKEAIEGVSMGEQVGVGNLISLSIERALTRLNPAAVMVPSRSGATARRISRLRLPVWIAGICSQETMCQALQFSYGVWPVYEPSEPDDWNAYVKAWLRTYNLRGDTAILTSGPSAKNPTANHSLEIIDLRTSAGAT